MNTYIEAILLGVLQGISEFLPISSSGHLQALKEVLGSTELGDQALDVFLHFATLLAVLIIFRGEFLRLIRGLWTPGKDRQLLFYVIVGAIPAGLAGLLLKKLVFDPYPDILTPYIGVFWLITAGVLWTLRKPSAGDVGDGVNMKTAVWIGCWQILALLPGISRSGITIAAALWRGTRRDEAATFSFLMATPLILGATLLEVLNLRDVIEAGEFPKERLWAYGVGSLVAFVTGVFALLVLLKMLRTGLLHWWAYYLAPVAVLYSGWWYWLR